MTESCTQTVDVVSHQHLRPASQRKMIVPRYRLNSDGRRRFAVVGLSTWHSLPDSLLDPALSLNIFRRHLKTHFFCELLTRRTQRIRDFFMRMRHINLHFTYFLTYMYTYPNKSVCRRDRTGYYQTTVSHWSITLLNYRLSTSAYNVDG